MTGLTIGGVQVGAGAPALIVADLTSEPALVEVLDERIRLATLAGADAVKVDADALLAGRGAMAAILRVARESHGLCVARCRSVAAIASAVGCGVDAIELDVGSLHDGALLEAAAACGAEVVLGAAETRGPELARAIARLQERAKRTLAMLSTGAPGLLAGGSFWGHTGDDLDPLRAAAAVIRGAAAIERPFTRDDDSARRVSFHDLVLGVRAEESWRVRCPAPRPTAA